MPSPQCEDGFTRLANELFEALLASGLTGNPLRVWLAIARKTYGFNKKSDAIGMTQIARMLGEGTDRHRVLEAIKVLEARNMILVVRAGRGRISTYTIQKDYAQWLTSTPQRTSMLERTSRTSTPERTTTSTPQRTHKRHERHDSTDDAIASSVSPAHKPKKTKLPKPTCPKEWMDALYDLCRVDVALASPGMRKRVSDCGLALIKAGKSPPEVATFKDRWYRLDWRGTDNQPPTPEQVRDQWQTVINLTRSNGHDQRRNKNHGLAGLRGGNSEYRVLSKEEWEAAKQAQRDGIDLGDGPALPNLRLPQERVAEK